MTYSFFIPRKQSAGLLFLNPLYIVAGAGVDPDQFARLDKERNRDVGAGLQNAELVAGVGGVALEAGIGIFDFKFHRRR